MKRDYYIAGTTIDDGVRRLMGIRDCLARHHVHAPKFLDAIRHAIKSGGGALRNARNQAARQRRFSPELVAAAHEAEKLNAPIDEPPDHEHSSGCWPGAENEFECPIMIAFREMAHVLTIITHNRTKKGDAFVRWLNSARKALKLAKSTEFTFYREDR